jgi:hypothetical protein
VILRYYVDVSGKESTPGERAVTAAGYIANESQWERFEHVWDLTLKEAKADYFHATEFFAFSGPFQWLRDNPEEHRRLAAMFALATYSLVPYGFSSSLDLEHFDPVFIKACRKLKTPHDRIPAAMIAIAEVCSQVAQRALPPGGLQAQLFLEAGDGVGEIVEWLRHLKKIGEPWTGAFVSFESRSGSEYPFQAADYLAHEAWREATQLMRNPSRTWDDKRESFKWLTSGPETSLPEVSTVKVDVRYATEEHFQRSAPQLVAFIAAHPEYQQLPWNHHWRRRSRRALKASVRETKRFFVRWQNRILYGWLRVRSPERKRRTKKQKR